MTSMTLSTDPNQHQPQHTYIHHHHPHTTTPSHCHKKTRSGSSNWRGQQNIVSWDLRSDTYGSDTNIKDRHDSSGSNDNIHYHEVSFHHSHSSCACQNQRSPNNHPPDDMNKEDTVETGWSVGKSRTTPSAPYAWHIRKNWIMLSTVCIGDVILVQA